MMQPQPLHAGDSIAIIATARKVSPQEIQPAVQLLQELGLHVVLPDGLFSSHNQFAGTDLHRATLLQQAINDPSIRAIWCARGGYGTARIIDRIDLSPLRQHPKWIIGYSDATVLHSHLHATLSLPTLHATMPINITSTQLHTPATHSLHQLLFGLPKVSYTFHTTNATTLNRPGQAEGIVVGGNLSILYSLLATPSDIDTSGKILLIEDLDEYLYHIDRMMQALRRAGKLRNLKGLIVGQFTDLHDNAIPFGSNYQQIILDATASYNYPIAFNAPFGHIGPDNHAIILGSKISMSVTETETTLNL